jgi:hypothetical protein
MVNLGLCSLLAAGFAEASTCVLHVVFCPDPSSNQHPSHAALML